MTAIDHMPAAGAATRSEGVRVFARSCWADKKADDPYACQEPSVDDLGLCPQHYAEIVGYPK